MTGTATLQIHLIDVNDNVPKLDENSVDVCLSDGQTPTNISATDPDGTPFGGPFAFQLLGDVKGKWKLAPSSGKTMTECREMSQHYNSTPHPLNKLCFCSRLHSWLSEGFQCVCRILHSYSEGVRSAGTEWR